jgi:hypothetical protein
MDGDVKMDGVRREGLERIVDGPHYVDVSPRGNLIVTIGNKQIATSVIYRDYFVHEWFSPEMLYIFSRYEERTQQLHKAEGPRKYSGLHAYNHIDIVFESLFSLAQLPNPVTGNNLTWIDFPTLIGAMGHDNIENREEYKKKLDQWRDAVEEGNRDDRIRLNIELATIRERLKKEEFGILKGYLTEVRNSRARDRSNFKGLDRDLGFAVELIDSVTRRFHEDPYAISMGKAYQIGRQNPLQASRKILIKNADRIANGLEFEPREEMPGIVGAFGDEVVVWKGNGGIDVTLREEFLNRFGEINAGAQPMPRAVRLQTAANSIFPLHYGGETINIINERMSKKTRYAKGTSGYVGLAILSRERLLNVAKDLVDSSIELYEGDRLIRKKREQVDREIAEKNQTDSTYFERATSPGTLQTLMVYDAGGTKFIVLIDKEQRRSQQNYRMAREVREMLPKFGRFFDPEIGGAGNRRYLSDVDQFDPKKHRFWTLPGMDELIGLQPDLWGQYAQLSRSYRQRRQSSSLWGRVTSILA